MVDEKEGKTGVDNRSVKQTPAEGNGGGREFSGQHKSKTLKSAKEIVEEIIRRSQRANDKLRANLAGRVKLQIGGSGPNYFLNFTSEGASLDDGSKDPDCEILVDERNLCRVANGELNPQLSMLSGKIKLKGQLSLGVYIFNLVAPNSSF